MSTLPAEKRWVYTPEQKNAMLALLQRRTGNKALALRIIVKKPGYEKVRHTHLRRWLKFGTKAKARTGRSVNEAFERAVLGHLVYTVLEQVDGVDTASVVANVTYSYDIAELAAKTTQKEAPWVDDAKIQKLKFSAKWVRGFLRRATLRRRRITSSDKVLPLPAVVAARMAEIQAVIKAGPVGGQHDGEEAGYKLGDLLSVDETGMHYSENPLNQYVPAGTERGTSSAFDDKKRFTAELGGTADGAMIATFIIMQCTKKGVDLRSTTVISTLHKKAGYTEADGWKFKIWDRKLVLKVKKEDKELHFYRPYIVHTDGTVITTQCKAWMDSAGLCMWVDVLIGPWARASKRKKLVVWDSCGPHLVAAVLKVFAEWFIATQLLPVNMTDRLQVMDLVVNGPIKAHMRSSRCKSLFNYFQDWKREWGQELQKPAGERVMPVFTPPKPNLVMGLNTVRSLPDKLFSKADFKAGLVRAFVNVGLAEDDKGEFVKYTSHKRGTMPVILAPADSPALNQFTLGGELVEGLDADSDDDSDDEPRDDLAAADGPDSDTDGDSTDEDD